MKNSLSVRSYLILSYSMLITLSLAAVGILWSGNEYWIITHELQSMVLEHASLVASVAGHELKEEDKIEIDTVEYAPEMTGRGLTVVYIDQSGALTNLTSGGLAPDKADLILDLYDDEAEYQDNYVELVDRDSTPVQVYAAAPVRDSANRVVGTVCVLYPLTRLESYIARQNWMLFGSVLTIGLLGILISIFLASYVSRHFSDAQNLAGTVAEGNYHLRIPESGPRELRDLSRYLNSMAAKLDEQAGIRRTLLANVAHELARPLTGLQLGIESLRKGALQDLDLADDILVGMGKATNNLEGLIEDITLTAQPAALPIALERTAVAVEPFLRGLEIRYWALAEAKDIHLVINVEPDLPMVDADEKRLNQILGNLLHNAIKFSPHGSSVCMSAEQASPTTLRIIVRDSGPGIAAADEARIFEAFFQGESGQRIKQGMGLGLAIAQQLALAHGGSLTLQNHPDGGAVAVLILPAACL